MDHLPTQVALRWCELPSGCEPLRVFDMLRRRELPWLLDSALRGARLGRYSFAGADPWALLRVRGEEVRVECRRKPDGAGARVAGDEVLESLRAWLPRLAPEVAAPPVPFVGGAVALLGYELAERLEPVRLHGLDDLGCADATLLLVDRSFAWDHVAGRAYACALGLGADEQQAQAAADAGLVATLGWLETSPGQPASAASAAGQPASPASAAGQPASPVSAAGQPAAWPEEFDEGGYAKAVDAVKQEISAGNVYQANLTQRMERRFAGDSWELYRALRRINPAPFACYVELPELAVVGSSPERFLKLDVAGRIESRPIKGTRPRGRHASEDAANRADLAASAKDRAENLMIVDLVRNDLGRVCETGSVDVAELMQIEEYASVFQLVSTVIGQLRPECDVFDAIRAAFPPGSMTGAPKIAAMQLLDRLEPVRRGIYSGAIGYLDARGGADLCVVIRTLFVQGERALLHAGGGVVADSGPRGEWRESLDKARALLAALDEASGA